MSNGDDFSDITDAIRKRLGLSGDAPQYNVPQTAPTGTPQTPTMTPEIQKYTELATHPPKREDYKPSFWRKLGSVVQGIGYGPQAQESFLNVPYSRALQSYGTELGAAKTAATLPFELAKQQADVEEEQAETEMYRGHTRYYQQQGLADALKAYKDVIDANRLHGRDRYIPVEGQIFDTDTKQFISGGPGSRPKNEEEQAIIDILGSQNIDPNTATPLQRVKARDQYNANKAKATYDATAAEREAIHKENLAIVQGFGREMTGLHLAEEDKRLLQSEQERTTKEIDDKYLHPLESDLDTMNVVKYSLGAKDTALDPDAGIKFLQMVATGKNFRLNYPEIQLQFGGGLTAVENFQRQLQRFQLDNPGQPWIIDPHMRDSWTKMLYVMENRKDKKVEAIDKAKNEITTARNPMEVMKIRNKLQKDLHDIDMTEIKVPPSIPKGTPLAP